MKKIFSVFVTALFSFSMILMPIIFAEAQTGTFDPGSGSGGGVGTFPGDDSSLSGTFRNPLEVAGINTISDFIRVVLDKIVIPIGAVVCVFFIIYAGFLYVAARGNPAAISKAHQALINALIGTLIILGSLAISLAIKGTVDQLQTGL